MIFEHLFFELLQVAIGNRNKLTRPLSDKEWRQMLDMSVKQSLAGIVFAGVEKLPKEQWPFQNVLFEWIGLVTEIESRNRQTTEACKDLCGKLEIDGFKACVLKGQANHSYYPKELRNRRTCGDIDIWAKPNTEVRGQRSDVRTVLEYVDENWERTGLCWLHCNFNHRSGVPVEVHFHPSFMNEPIRNRRFLKHFSDFDDCVCKKEIEDGVVIPAMKPEYDAIFQMNHIYRHLIDEGVGLRQIVDYYMLLRSVHDSGLMVQRFKEERMRVIEQFGMKRFAGALMYVLREVLAMPEEYMLCAASEKDGKFLLNEIMLAGNFGHSDPRMGALNTENVTNRRLSQAGRRFKRNMRFLTSYPSEVIFEPYARLWHFAWKKLGL